MSCFFVSKKLARFRQGPAPSAHGHFVLRRMNSFVSYRCLEGVLVMHVSGDDGEGCVGCLPDGVCQASDAVGSVGVVRALHTILKI